MNAIYQHILLNLERAPRTQYWTSIAVLVFALAFVIVGLARVVEFNGLGLSPLRRRVLRIFHCVGVVSFGLSFAMLAVDLDRSLQKYSGALLLSALIFLFPAHIYTALIRRIELRRRMDAQT